MERDRVIRILWFFRDIDREISLNTRILRDLEDEYYNMGGDSRIGGTLKNRHKISKPTETIALNIPDSVSMVMSELRAENVRLGELRNTILQEINCLPEPQKSIVNDFYISGLQWVQISANVHYSATQCKKVRNCALDNLAKQFTGNKILERLIFL
jgi:DNA-directed RNA polymerase specialized sigma subunit